MELKGEQRIAAPRQKVWEALNNPRVLQACIPGCEALTQDGDDAFDAVLLIKAGPVRARFNGRMQLSNIDPPSSYTISGEAQGGGAGMAKGGADVRLVEDGDATMLHYEVKVDVGGKLAQVGSRLITSTVNRHASDFFGRFGQIVTGEVPIAEVVPAAAAASAAARPAPTERDEVVAHLRRLNWALIAIILALVGYEVIRLIVTGH
jgi:carbon monoxide dehydrogenase subunit G